MDGLKLMLYGLLCGVKDSILGLWALWFIDEETEKKKPIPVPVSRSRRVQPKQEVPRVKNRVIQCCLLNGGVFWLSILFFHSIFLPGSQYITELLIGPGANMIWEVMSPFLQVLFSALWVLPLFILSRIVNSLWFMDIADRAYRQSRGRPQTIPSLSKFVADMIFSLIIQLFFLIQSMLVALLPLIIIGPVVSVIHLALLYSLYAFEYKWFNMGWELHKRLGFIENNWTYFLGFGLPLAILTSIPSSQIVSGCVFSILFPLLIISANEAEPMTGTCEFSLQLFSPVVALSNWLFHHAMRRRKVK